MKFTDAQVSAVMAGKFEPTTIPLPGVPKERGLVVSVRVLTEAELDACRANAQVKLRRWAEGKKYDPTTVVDIDPTMLSRYIEREIVFSAFYDSENPKERFFPTLHDVEGLDAASLTYFMRAFEDHQQFATPLQEMTDTEVKEFVDSLGNASSASAELHRFERSTLVRCVLSMAARLRGSTSQTSK